MLAIYNFVMHSLCMVLIVGTSHFLIHNEFIKKNYLFVFAFTISTNLKLCLLCVEKLNRCSAEPENRKIFHRVLNDEGLQQNKIVYM